MEIKELYEIFRRCGSVSTDSRTVCDGELFIALKGESFDGNLYAAAALESGAAYAVVDASSEAAALASSYPDAEGGSRIIPVRDTLATLQDLARWHRENVGAEGRRVPVIGITGTNGKTTTKELIRTVLAAGLNVTATQGNLNNDIGVPLSLLKITPDTDVAIIEMGASHPDDIAKLVQVSRPDLGIITNVGKAHLQGFGSFEGVKKAKGALYDFLAGNGGGVFVNADDPVLLSMAAERPGLKVIPYGLGHDGAALLETSADEPFVRIRLSGGKVLRTSLVGAYNASNIMAALCIGRYFGVPEEAALKAVSEYVPSNSRSQMVRTGENVLVVDAYNANPSSMKAALENFASFTASHKVAMLGDMRELGQDSVKEHENVLALALSCGIETLYLVGEEFSKALRGVVVPDGVDVRWYPDSQSLADAVSADPFKGCLVLVKGSRGTMMEKAIPAIP
ncbi:MAG: UDP-N-acetylmuramoyl-tripeptide--D-alanyl-D-alanine ligase [Candidatus Cryptobacteroides sp.]